MLKLNVLVAGASGYIGLQLIKLILKHKNLKIRYLCGDSSIGKNLSKYDIYFKSKKLPKIIKFNFNLLKKVDVVFTALPNGEAQKISKKISKNNILIDLAGDFRLSNKDYFKWYKIKHKAKQKVHKSIYSLPEIVNKKVKNYQILSCPGCYPTSILLPLVPLIKKNLISNKNIIIDSKSGYSGGGRGIHKKYKNKNLYESLRVYGVSTHKHNPEIKNAFKNFTNRNIDFIFTPHLSPMFRGILSTIYIDLNKNFKIKVLINELKRFYKKNKFIKILKKNTLLSTNEVIDTNYCYISICETSSKNKIILLSAIDNLIKGGSGQAIQNLNNYFDFPSNRGLE